MSGAPLRKSCLFLLEGGFVSSLWDAVFSIAQSLSCLEVLSQAGERSYHVRIPWYKLHKTQLICISSKDIYLEIQNLFDKYLLSTYCMPGIIQGTGNAYNRLSPCPQGACILIISGQEVLGWQRAGWGLGVLRVSGFVAAAQPCPLEPGSLHPAQLSSTH